MKILINPDSLRSTAKRLNEAASELGLYARSIGNTDVAAFAPDIRSYALGVTQDVRRELVSVSSELGQEADVLRARATVAERGGLWGLALGPFLPVTGTPAISTLARTADRALGAAGALGTFEQLRSNFKIFALKWGNQYGHGYVLRDGKAAGKYVRDLVRNDAKFGRFVKLAGVGILTGSLTAVDGWRNVERHEYGSSQRPGPDRDDVETWGDALQTVSGGMTAVGSGLLLGAVRFPPLLPVGGAVLAASFGFDAAGAGLNYAADHWDAPRRAWDAAAKRFTNFAGSIF